MIVNHIPNPKPRQGGELWNTNRKDVQAVIRDSLKIESPVGVPDCFAYANITLPKGDYAFAATLLYATSDTATMMDNRALTVCDNVTPSFPWGTNVLASTPYKGLRRRYEVLFTLKDTSTIALRVQGRHRVEEQDGLSVTWNDLMCCTAPDQQVLLNLSRTWFDGQTLGGGCPYRFVKSYQLDCVSFLGHVSPCRWRLAVQAVRCMGW